MPADRPPGGTPHGLKTLLRLAGTSGYSTHISTYSGLVEQPVDKTARHMSTRQKRFRIALSFPGEHRAFVEQVAAHLASRVGQERVLYDKYYEAEFARPDLDTYLQHLYHDESELIAVFLCADYQRKEWCGLEWRAIRDLIKMREVSTVMPFRFDDTEIPGLFSIDGYIWIGDRPAQEVADGRGDWRPSRLADAVEASEALRIVHVPLAVLLTTVSLIVEHPLNQPIVRERSGMRGVSPSPDQLERMGEILGGCDVIACISARVPSLAEEVFSWPDASRRFLQPTGSLPREATLTLAREATDIVMNLAELLILGRQAGLKVPDITEENPEAPFRGAELLDRLRSRGIAACNVVVTLGPRGSLVADGLRHEVYFLALESVNSERKVDMQVGNGDRFLGSLIAYETAPGTSPDSGESQGRIVASALQATCFVAEKLGIPRDAYRVVPRRL